VLYWLKIDFAIGEGSSINSFYNLEFINWFLNLKFNPINYTFFRENDRWYYFDKTIVYDGEKLSFTEDF
jgi:hypothetical protein